MADLFSDLDPDSGAASAAVAPAPQQPNTTADPFSDLDPDNGPGATSAVGAGARAAERSIIPAAGGIVGAGAGAEAGAAIGGGVGAFFGGVGAVPGAAIGGIVGGLAGGFGGSYAADQAQSFAAKGVPEQWKDVLGGNDRQQQLDQTYQPTASFLGGMVPYVLTMHPGIGGTAAALPDNATALQRIGANPVLNRVFSGTLMGGMQLGQEAASGQPIDWNNVAIATGMGMVFNKPNAIGQKLESIGAAGAGRMMGRAAPATPEEAAAAPTIAQAGDAKVVGPGITEDVFMGNHQQAPAAEQAAQDAARTESSVLGTTPAPVPDVGAIARKQEPELFGQWDALTQQQDDLRAHLASLASPADEDIDAVSQQRDALQQQLDEHIASRGGYEGGAQARALRAQVRDQQSQVDQMTARRDAFAAGQGADTPEMSAIRQQIQATDLQLRDLAPQVSAANRRAADYAGTETVEPQSAPAPEAQPETPETPETQPTGFSAQTGGPVSGEVQQQAAAIASSIARQFEAAGRPADEAEALGRTEAARIVQRSQRMNGALGEPLNLYNSEGANIVRGGDRAQAATPTEAAPAPIAPAVEPTPAADPAEAIAAAKAAGQTKLIDKLLGLGASNKEIADTIGRKLSENQIAAYRSAAPAKPPLMPTVDEPAIGNPPEIVAQRQQQQAEPSVVNQETAPRPAGGIEALDPSTIGVDANRFQFKAGGDESGVTERLQGVEKWDPRLAGTALVYRDESGKNWIADGHQRLALAQRLAAGQPDIRLNSFVLDAADGVTDADARAIAAVKNIAEGTGTAIDAAKVIREAKETGITLPPLPPRSTLVRDGNALSSLSPDAFGMVVNEVISPADGAMVGRLVKDPDQQSEAVRLLSQAKPENAQQAEMIVRDMLGSGTEMMTKQGGLFGDEAFASSVVLERAKIADQAVKLLRKDKATFGTLVKEAERIQGAGSNILDQEANQSRLSTDEKASDLLTQLAFRAGPVSDALSGIARRLKSGDISPAEGAREFLGSVRSAVEGGVDTGADVGGAVAGAAGEREGLEPHSSLNRASSWVIREKATGRVVSETFNPQMVERLNTDKYEAVPVQQHLGEVNTPGTLAHSVARGEAAPLATEPGAEGLPQTLIPGVEPISDAQRAQLEADRGLHGGDAAPGGLFDEDAQNQQTLFSGKRGSVTFKEQKPVLRIFQEANASTGIHELGHIWLEDMLKDAVHPAANDELRADAQTIRKNLGMTDDQSKPLTQQHEQFAKWTEQYLREGRAPSAELAGVFAKFKSWLTQIYQTVKGLGLPLNDDMRGVFDRLLTSEPNRTVIAPEAERPATLAATHETDAAQVHPAEAEPVGDRIVAERDAEIARQSPEVQNEIAEAIQRHAATVEPGGGAAAEPGSEDVNGAGGQSEVVGGGVGPNAEPTGGGNSGERGAVERGSAEGVQQGTNVPSSVGESGLRQQRSGADENARSANPLQPEPAATIPRNGNGLTDLAGNIRVENLTSEADVAQAIKQSAAENNNFIGDRRGVITDGQVVDLADALGMDATTLSRRKLGEAFNAEQIVAARKLLIQSATDLGGIAQKAANGTDADVTAYAMAKARHNMIQSHVAGLTAEAGRALRAFRSLVGQEQAKAVGDFLQQSDARTLFQLKAEAKMMAELDTPEKVSKFARDAEKPDFWDHVLEYWTNGLISNPATHATYAAGTEMMSLLRAGPETAAAAAIGRLRQIMGRQGERVHLAEVGAAMRAHLESAPTGVKAMADSLVSGTTTLLPGEKPRSTPFQPKGEFAPHSTLQEGYTGSQLLSDLYGTTRGILDGTLASGVLERAAERAQEEPGIGLEHSPLGVIPNVRLGNGIVVPTGDILRAPSRGVAALHSFFKATNYSMNMARQAVRQASEEGLDGQAFDARVAELRQSPTPAMFDAYDKAQRSGGTVPPEIESAVVRARTAAAQAMDTTLMGPGSEFVKALSNLTNKRIFGLPILKFVDPFVKIGANVINQAIVERTPLGIFSPEIRADLTGKNGNVAQDTAQARMLVGTALSIGFGALAARGVISGSGPSDPNRAAMWRLAGNQPYSVRIGDTWYSLSHLGPLGMILGVSADMYDVSHAASEGDMLAAGSTLMHAVTQNILDASFMRGPSELIQAVDNPGRYGQAYIRNFASSFMPFSSLSAQLARMGDPYTRQARSVMDGIKAKVPGMAESLMPYRNIYGEPEQNFGAFGGMTSVYQSPVSKDPVSIGLWNLGINVSQPERSIRGVRLNDEQYAMYQQLAGRMLHSRLTTIMTSPDWSTWTPEAQQSVVQAVKDQSRETARNALMGQFPTIANQAYTAKLAKLRGTPQ